MEGVKKMNKELKIAVITLIVDVIAIIVEILGIVVGISTNTIIVSSKVIIYIIVFALLSILLLVVITKLVKYIKQKNDLTDYVNFIEFLMHNNRHCFVILPKIRMYIHSKRLTNDVKVKLLRITYDITKNAEHEELGDMIINYDLDIANNNNIPNQFHFVYGTDYSKCTPIVKYNYGNDSVEPYYTATKENEEKVAPYWLGFLRHYKLGIDHNKISQSDTLKLRIGLECKEAFDFSIKRDTIICLPDMFSKDVEKIEYQINLRGYDKVFYCNAYRVSNDGKAFSIDEVTDPNKPSYSFKQSFYPGVIKGEKAFFFRIGQSEIDPEFI